MIPITLYVFRRSRMNKHSNAVSPAGLQHCRKFWTNLRLVLKRDKYIRINEELVVAHGLRTAQVQVEHKGKIVVVQIRSAPAAPSGREVGGIRAAYSEKSHNPAHSRKSMHQIRVCE